MLRKEFSAIRFPSFLGVKLISVQNAFDYQKTANNAKLTSGAGIAFQDIHVSSYGTINLRSGIFLINMSN